MSATGPDPDLVPIGQTPEWIKWFEEALAHLRDQGLPHEDWSGKPLRLTGFEPDLIDEHTKILLVHDEKTRVRAKLVPLVHEAGPANTINHYPWDFRP